MADRDGLLTEQEFDAYLRTWALRVEMSAKMNLAAQTHSSGNLMESLRKFVDKMRNGVGRHIAFKFPQYGVFRAYGAGRGWVVINGVPVKGHRVLTAREIKEKTLNPLARGMMKRGYTFGEVKKAKVADKNISEPRRALDWIDGEVVKRQNELADASVGFFGDTALAGILKELDKAKIVKKQKS